MAFIRKIRNILSSKWNTNKCVICRKPRTEAEGSDLCCVCKKSSDEKLALMLTDINYMPFV